MLSRIIRSTTTVRPDAREIVKINCELLVPFLTLLQAGGRSRLTCRLRFQQNSK